MQLQRDNFAPQLYTAKMLSIIIQLTRVGHAKSTRIAVFCYLVDSNNIIMS